MDSQLPRALERKTVFGITGQIMPVALALIGFAGLAWFRRYQKKASESEI
jgi:hypothetical protein